MLYLVPSISLFQQSMREWATQRAIPHRYIGICSDTRAGRNDEDASLQELEIPVTTDPSMISRALRLSRPGAITVVFCTYHSLGIVERAQDDGAPAFDIVLCDEAHRTTGIERPGDPTSPFVLVHDAERIRAAKCLYMTATPRLYTEGAKAKAASHETEVFSMDDPATYGPEFHRLPFSRAVEQDLLSDYKVVVLAMSEQHVDARCRRIWLRAAARSTSPTRRRSSVAGARCRTRGISAPAMDRFPISPVRSRSPTPLNSRSAWWPIGTTSSGKPSNICPRRRGPVPSAARRATSMRQHHALERKRRIEWLKGDSGGTCRILSNARCLSEGIDVPALDAVLFMDSRKSQVDIVQAVGRAHAQGCGQAVRLHRASGRRSGGRRSGQSPRRQRAVRRCLGRLARTALAR